MLSVLVYGVRYLSRPLSPPHSGHSLQAVLTCNNRTAVRTPHLPIVGAHDPTRPDPSSSTPFFILHRQSTSRFRFLVLASWPCLFIDWVTITQVFSFWQAWSWSGFDALMRDALSLLGVKASRIPAGRLGREVPRALPCCAVRLVFRQVAPALPQSTSVHSCSSSSPLLLRCRPHGHPRKWRAYLGQSVDFSVQLPHPGNVGVHDGLASARSRFSLGCASRRGDWCVACHSRADLAPRR